MSYLYVPDMEASDSGLESQCQLLAPSVSWRGKLRAAPLWLRGCKRDLWLRHLFGQTSQPLTASLGVERWISSLLESRVSPGASQESKQDLKTSDTLAKSSSVSLAKWDQATSSLRTSPGLFDSEPPIFSGDFPKSGMMRNGVFFRQPESAQLIDGNASSCWPIGDAWPTATAGDSRGSARGTTTTGVMHAGESLTDVMRNWPTPNARDHKGSPDPKNRDRMTGQLDEAAERKWATPQARDYRSPDNPQTGNYKRKVEKGWTIDLNTQAAHHFPLVPTETGAESPKSTSQRWPSPQASDWKNKSCSRDTALSNDKAMPEFAQTWKNKKRLNPRFVEWLMGLPDGWTSSGCSATELSRYKRLMRSALYCNESTTNPKPDND